MNNFGVVIFAKTLFKILLAFFSFFLFITIVFIPISIKLYNLIGYISANKTYVKNNILSQERNIFKKIYLIVISVIYAPTVGAILCLYAFVFGLVSYISIIFKKNGSVFWNLMPVIFMPLFYNIAQSKNTNLKIDDFNF